MITEIDFTILHTLYSPNNRCSPAILEDSKTISSLLDRGLIAKDSSNTAASLVLTEQGRQELNPYKVKNAIIMAAGYSSRFVPLSYEKPKSLLNIKGEILIERQIRQLKEAGIEEIIIVVGYLKEQFYYLKEKYQVVIVENLEYTYRNNNSSIHAVKEYLDNSYICSSDNYFTENVFESHVFRAYYSTKFSTDGTGEYCITTDEQEKIIEVTIGGTNTWYMLGHVFFSRDFSKSFIQYLEQEYSFPETADMFWEDIYIRHIDSLELFARKYKDDIILEFDSLEDLRKFDSRYLQSTGSKYMEQIAEELHCSQNDIVNIRPVKESNGMVHFTFQIGDSNYRFYQTQLHFLHKS
jgi:CTP:phosphocholine cytidylyltransferase-like protein